MSLLDHPDVASTLSEGRQGHLTVVAARGPHTTPHLYAVGGGCIVSFAAAGTLKDKLLRQDERACTLVRIGSRSVVVAGRVDVLDPARVGDLLSSPSDLAEVGKASAGFVVRNAPDLAAFAGDALTGEVGSLPPPRRVALRLEPAAVALLDGDEVLGAWGSWAGTVGDHGTGAELPGTGHVDAAVGWLCPTGPLTLPARWSSEDNLARVPPALLELAGAPHAGPVAVTVDEYRSPGPAAKEGVLLRGDGKMRDGEPGLIAVQVERRTQWDGVETATEHLGDASPPSTAGRS